MAETLALPQGTLMAGKKGLVLGVANHHSIAWAIASQLAAQGAELAFSYIEAMEKRVKPLGESLGVKLFFPADVTDDQALSLMFEGLEQSFGTLDFIVHAAAFSNKDELRGSFVENTTRENFLNSMNISVYSFIELSRRAEKLMPNGGSIITLTYLGSERVIPNYNVMGVCKAALESSVRYAARDLGPKKIRVNAISAGPIKTLSLSGIQDSRKMLSLGRSFSALQEDTSLEGVAGCALWLLSDLGRSTTGEVVHVDAGFHMMGLPESVTEA